MTKILIVDDHPDIRKLLRLSLGKRYEIFEAEDAVTAWELIRRERPQVVILDVMMPGEFDGYELCERIKHSELAATYVALVTARGQAVDEQRGRAAGADDYFVKPFSPLQLVRTIENRIG